MKKIVIPIFIGILFLVTSVGLSGCFEGINQETNILEKFVGTWKLNAAELWYELPDVNEITFSNVNSFNTDTNINGDYKIEKEKLVLTINNGERVISFSFKFSDDYQMMTLEDINGHAASYIKKI